MKTLLDTLNSGTEWLEKRGIEDARRNMQLLLCEIMGFENPMQLYTQFDQPMTEEKLAPLREMLKNRSKGIPLQHIIGWVEFFKRKFKTDHRALIPRPETEELVDIILQSELPKTSNYLDVGTGSGVIGLTLAAEFADSGGSATLIDISTEALSLAQENAGALELKNVDFLESNLLEKIENTFDCIVANLPYIPEEEQKNLSVEVSHDPALALYSGIDGLDLIRQFLSQAREHLKPNGMLAMEIGIHQSKQVENLLAEEGFSAIQTRHDLNGIARFPLARR